MTEPSRKSDRETPLCIDLDGTLIHSDMMFESLVLLLGRNPLLLFSVLFWWTKGRAHLKAQLAAHVTVDPSTLPYNQELVCWIKAEQATGRRVLLVTASDIRMVQGVARHAGIFDEVLASDGKRNLRGRNKGETLAALFGEKGFDYAGNSRVDLPVWERSRKAIVVNGSTGLASRAAKRAELGPVFPRSHCSLREFHKLLRVPDLITNLAIFTPLLFAFFGGRQPRVASAVAGFIALLLCTAGGNVLNELFRLDKDRKNPVRHSRPFAAGTLEIQAGAIWGSVLAGLGLFAAIATAPVLLFVAALVVIIEAIRPNSDDGPCAIDWAICWSGLIALRLLAGLIAL